jgi:hypothetical protein
MTEEQPQSTQSSFDWSDDIETAAEIEPLSVFEKTAL